MKRGTIHIKTFSQDLLASMVVFLVALPLCMGIAIASGAPPLLGMITGIVGGLVVGALAGAPLQVSGPAAGLTVLVYDIVTRFGLEMLGPAVLLAGLIQAVAGWAKLGRWFRAVSPSVIYGMLAGIGVLIFASQFHIMVDDAPRGSGVANLLAIPEAIYKVFVPGEEGNGIHFMAGMIGLATIATMILWEYLPKNPLRVLPAPLVAVLLGTGIATLWGFPIQKVSIPEDIGTLIHLPTGETLLGLFRPEVLSAVVGLALIASAETLLCASALTKMKPDAQVDYDRELLAQGVGNTVCGVLGALPMTGVIVRSSANIKAGGQTRVSAMLHGLWLFIFVLMVPHLLRYIPMASLAAVLVYTGYKLVNPANIKNLARYGRSAVGIYLLTLVGIVLTNLLTGVLLGVAASLLKLIYSFSRLRIVESLDAEPGVHHLYLSGAATVFNLPKFAASLESIPSDKKVVVHCDRLFYIDHACMDLLETIAVQRKQMGSSLELDVPRLKLKYHRSDLRAYTAPAASPLAAVKVSAPVEKNGPV